MAKSLAVKYRPKTWEDVCEQDAIKIILQEQVRTNTHKHSYLFVGPAGCGKTTCARIFANELNAGKGAPIEVDAASHSGVDHVRGIVEDAKRKPITGQYKAYILDEAHSFSSGAWQAFLKLLEEPPASAVFIFCTTEAGKIPATILSRVQRYDFSKMSLETIKKRLWYILEQESGVDPMYCAKPDAVDYLAKMAEGGMRTAITMLDQCLSYSEDLSLENILEVLGTASYGQYFTLMLSIFNEDSVSAIDIVERNYNSGIDLKQFMRQFQFFLLDVAKFKVFNSFETVHIPDVDNYRELMESEDLQSVLSLLRWCQKLNNDIKWDNSPRYMIETAVMLAALAKEE